MAYRSRVTALVLVLSALAVSAAGQESERTEIRYRQKTYPLYPVLLDQSPEVPSPLLAEDGTELVLATTREGRSTFIPVTVENGADYEYARSGKGRQLDVDGGDFPTLARTGLHSDLELAQAKTITDRSVAEITEIGRPDNSSGIGFMSDDEDIVSVLRGDNRLVGALGLTHPQLARPLFHVWNSILAQLHAIRHHGRPWGEIVEIRYHGRKISLEWQTTRGWQESIFHDEIYGGCHIYISREPEEAERTFLQNAYPRLSPEAMTQLVTKLSRIHIGEMVPYYVMRYGFYEGHTDYRADPLAIAFIFGLRSIEEIEQAFAGELEATLTDHFTRESRGGAAGASR